MNLPSGMVRSPFFPMQRIVVSSVESTVAQSPLGSASAREPPIVPRLRTWTSAMPEAQSWRIGTFATVSANQIAAGQQINKSATTISLDLCGRAAGTTAAGTEALPCACKAPSHGSQGEGHYCGACDRQRGREPCPGAGGFENHTQRKQHGSGEQRQGQPTSCSLLKVDPVEHDAENDHQHGKANPMRVQINLANIGVLGAAKSVDGSMSLGEIALGGPDERSRQRGTHSIQSLVLREQGVIEAVAHADRRQGQASEDQQLAGPVHSATPASSRPV